MKSAVVKVESFANSLLGMFCLSILLVIGMMLWIWSAGLYHHHWFAVACVTDVDQRMWHHVWPMRVACFLDARTRPHMWPTHVACLVVSSLLGVDHRSWHYFGPAHEATLLRPRCWPTQACRRRSTLFCSARETNTCISQNCKTHINNFVLKLWLGYE